ncbi:hypothetical protein CSUI_002273 [Cystoisospora suis]|uniref:Uncharacterized protein n=1 Tax=Cystoisospora suis TaxID=483139 RepID=A0A2C6L8R3_9APIC|nr:hypothetical protein CSUI_002273 [Cystoisospora suis]
MSGGQNCSGGSPRSRGGEQRWYVLPVSFLSGLPHELKGVLSCLRKLSIASRSQNRLPEGSEMTKPRRMESVSSSTLHEHALFPAYFPKRYVMGTAEGSDSPPSSPQGCSGV